MTKSHEINRSKITKPPRILLSNDDGIHAPGLKVLEKIARQLSDDVWIVAPEIEHSGAGHSLTLRRPLRIRKVSEQKFAIDGTPTDCVMLAILKIMEDKKPTLTLSGVNQGTNAGEDVTYSGTVAAAMESTLLGVPAIALSQATHNGHPVKWSTAEHFAPQIIKQLMQQTYPSNVLLNINFPDVVSGSVRGIRVVKQGLRNLRENVLEWEDPRGNPFYWIGAGHRDDSPTEIKTDLEALQEGAIAVTPLHLDLTHHSTLKNLERIFTLSQEEVPAAASQEEAGSWGEVRLDRRSK